MDTSYFNVRDEEDGSQYDSEDEKVLKQQQGEYQKQVVNREAELKQKVEEMQRIFADGILKKMRVEQRKKGIPWIETLEITSDKSVQLVKAQVNDDVQRELQFYNIALENARKGLSKLKASNQKIIRPTDYMAEMYKTDEIMLKIKNNLVSQQVKIQNLEEKKNRVANKKFTKKLVQYKKIEETRSKKRNLDAINRWKDDIKQKGEKAGELESFMRKPSRKGARSDAKEAKGARRPDAIRGKKISKGGKPSGKGGKSGGARKGKTSGRKH